MQVSREIQSEKFIPVIIKLETQKEVDELFALLSFVAIAKCVPLLSKEFNELRQYVSKKCLSVQDDLIQILK